MFSQFSFQNVRLHECTKNIYFVWNIETAVCFQVLYCYACVFYVCTVRLCVRACAEVCACCECWQHVVSFTLWFYDTILTAFTSYLHCMLTFRCYSSAFITVDLLWGCVLSQWSFFVLFCFLLAVSVMSPVIVQILSRLLWALQMHAGVPDTHLIPLTSFPCPASRRWRLAKCPIPLRSVFSIKPCEVCLFSPATPLFTSRQNGPGAQSLEVLHNIKDGDA